MKRASYRHAVEWIALNDEAAIMDVGDIADGVSTLLIADIFDVPPEKVAKDILKVRERDDHGRS